MNINVTISKGKNDFDYKFVNVEAEIKSEGVGILCIKDGDHTYGFPLTSVVAYDAWGNVV